MNMSFPQSAGKLLMGVIAFVCLFSSCTKLGKVAGADISDWDPNIALALIDTRATIQDVLNKFETGGFIRTEADGSLTLVYQGNVFSVTGEVITEIPDFAIPVLDSFFVTQFEFPLGYVISHMDFKGGTVDYSLTSTLSEPVSVQLQFPGATKNGQLFEETILLPDANTVTGSIDLAGSSFDFTNNEFPVRYVATRVSDGERVLLDASSQVVFANTEYTYAEGYVGNYEFALPLDTIVLDVFQNWQQGEIYFAEPKIDFIIDNSFGFPIRLTADTLDAFTFKSGLVPFDITQLSNGVDFAYPGLSEVGVSKQTIITIDNTSNFEEIIRDIPKEIYYKVTAEANPDNDPNVNAHFTDSSAFSVDVNVELPLYGWAQGFTLEDTFQLDLSIYEEFESIDFKLVTSNGFPAELQLQLYFEDINGNVLDSLIHEDEPVILAAAPVDGSGRVTEENRVDIYSQFDSARYENIRTTAKQLRMRASVETTDAGVTPVRFYSDYGLEIKLGARGNLNMEAFSQ